MAKVPRQEFRFYSEEQKKDLEILMKIRKERVLNTIISKAIDDMIERNQEAIDHHKEQQRLKREARKFERL